MRLLHPPNSFRLAGLAVIALFTVFVPPARATDDPSTVLILVNDAFAPETGTGTVGASDYVGQHYATMRNIPTSNIVHLNIPYSVMLYTDSQFINYADYVTYIQTPVQNYLTANNLANKILYIVPTYGVPVMLADPLPDDVGNPGPYTETWRVSVDSVLAAMNSGVTSQWPSNPYYDPVITDSPAHFKNWTNPGGWKMYVVCRLDGPSALIAAGLVDKAIQGEAQVTLQNYGTAYFDYIGFSPSNVDWYFDNEVLQTYNEALTLGINSSLNNQFLTGDYIDTDQGPNASWVWGWYHPVVDAYPTPMPGAIGAQLTSYTANYIRNGGIPGQDAYWCPYFLNAGFTATWGATGEPYASGYAEGNSLFGHFWRGYNFGESAYLANPFNNWMMVFIGDPLYAPPAFAAPVTPPPDPYVITDTTTLGNWQGIYGTDGYYIANSVSQKPSYATLNITGDTLNTWSTSSTDPNALQLPAGGNIASDYQSTGTMTFDINITDGNTHPVALYLYDWGSVIGENYYRTETIQVVNVATGAVVDTRPMSDFQSGQYLVYNLSGHVQINIINTCTPNAVVSGIFFGGALATQTAFVKWESTYFTSAQMNDPDISGTNATPQNDGVPNILKYVCDINPSAPITASNRGFLPALGMTPISGTTYLTLTYHQISSLSGVAVSVQTASSLTPGIGVSPGIVGPSAIATSPWQTWQGSPDFPPIIQIGTDTTTGDKIMEARVPVTGSKQFIRLNVVGS